MPSDQADQFLFPIPVCALPYGFADDIHHIWARLFKCPKDGIAMLGQHGQQSPDAVPVCRFSHGADRHALYLTVRIREQLMQQGMADVVPGIL